MLDPGGFDIEKETAASRQPMIELLAEHGVVTHVMDPRMALKPLITHRRHRTEYRALATGRVVTVEVDEDV
jgi:hypothetical protein